jgi:hypothetical protein
VRFSHERFGELPASLPGHDGIVGQCADVFVRSSTRSL